LKSIAAAVDKYFDEENDAILAMIRGSDSPGPTVASDQPDTIWDTLVDCSRETKSSSQRAEALRVSAIWEKIRADNLQKLYSAAQPVGSPQCRNLDRINDIVIVAQRQKDGEQPETGGILVRKELLDCANASYRLNQGKPRSEEAAALWNLASWTDRNQRDLVHRYNALVREYNELHAHDDSMVTSYNTLAGDFERLLAAASRYLSSSDSYTRSLERAVLFQSMERKPLNCTGTGYSYGTWGTFSADCH
jgi:hypothetical protein